MKTYHVFIASSLSFQKERDLMEKVLTERNNSELNIVVHRHEKNGDNDLAKGDTQEIINSEIRQCVVIIFFAVFADVFFDYETLVIQQNASLKLQPPSVEHWLGTDEVGRDILARIVHGARISLPVAFATSAIATVVGGLLGAIAGYGSRRVDDVIMRVMDIFLAIPSILLSIALVSAMGTSVTNMMLAISISNIPPFARIVRSAVLTIKNEEYIEAARAIGASDKRIILKHILPNCMAPIIVKATLSIAGSILPPPRIP